MKTTFKVLATTLLVTLIAYACMNNDKSRLKRVPVNLELQLKSEEGFNEGVSGAYSGVLGEWLIYGGGCNFPNSNPSSKRYYSSLFALRPLGDEWETIKVGELPSPRGYGLSLLSCDANSLYFIGGTDDKSTFNTIIQVTLEEGKPVVREHDETLPHGWYEGSGAVVDDQLYLIGGWQVAGTPMEGVLRVSLESGASHELLPLPDGARIQPISFAHEGFLYLYGGHRPARGVEEAPIMHSKAYRLELAQPNKGWEEIDEYPTLNEEGGRRLLFVGTAVAREPQSGNIYAVGGVDWDIFENAVVREFNEAIAKREGDPEVLVRFDEDRQAYLAMEPEEYNFMPYIIRFYPEETSWSVVDSNRAYATAGAILAASPEHLYIVGGERKPRVRTADIWQFQLNP